jgi:DNA-binding GntR family transcriptional regulator
MSIHDRARWKRLADHLGHQIRTGEYRHGDKLPTELRLQKEHGLSRTTVRVAIAQLRAEGLVETRRAEGTFVAAAPDTIRLAAGDWVTAACALTVTWADGSRTSYPAGTRFGPR